MAIYIGGVMLLLACWKNSSALWTVKFKLDLDWELESLRPLGGRCSNSWAGRVHVIFVPCDVNQT